MSTAVAVQTVTFDAFERQDTLIALTDVDEPFEFFDHEAVVMDEASCDEIGAAAGKDQYVLQDETISQLDLANVSDGLSSAISTHDTNGLAQLLLIDRVGREGEMARGAGVIDPFLFGADEVAVLLNGGVDLDVRRVHCKLG